MDGLVFGTYVHGLFDEDLFRHSLIDVFRHAVGLEPAAEKIFVTADRERRIDRWADQLRISLDIDQIRSWLPG
jgi:adenosylcobyric acid synthase